jgi:hypothetical protein
MKLLILFIGCIILLNNTRAQLNLQQFNKEQAAINKTAFIVLGSWSAANIITGLAGQANTSGQSKYFHQMNLIWGSVNLLIAGSGYIGAKRKANDLSFAASVKQQSVIEKTFLFNAGLDLAYLAGGAYFMEKGKNNSNPDKYKGYGKSILLQGGVLLLFDVMMYITHNHHGKKLWNALNALQAGPNSLGLNISLH